MSPMGIFWAALALLASFSPEGVLAASVHRKRTATPAAHKKTAAPPPRAGEAKPGSLPLGVVASVNGVPIRQVRLDTIVDQMIQSRPEGSKEPTAAERVQVRKGVLRTLIGRELLLQHSRKEGFAATDAEVNDALAGIRQSFFEGSNAKMQEQLGRDEMTMAELRENLKESIILSKLKKKAYDRTSASPEEIRRTYEEHKSEFVKPESVRARNIYIRADKSSTPEQDRASRARIDAARAQAGKGDFAAAARRYSEAKNASKGGDMGEVTRRAPLMPDMIDILFRTPPGRISDPFRNDIGWHVVKVESKSPEHQLTLEEATEPIVRAVRIQNTEQEMAGLAEKLWRQGKVESRIALTPDAAPAGSPPPPSGR